MPEINDKMCRMAATDDVVPRRGKASDIESSIEVAVAAGLWDATDTDPVRVLLNSAVTASGPVWLVVGPPEGATGIACAQPIVGTDRAWDLTMIGVTPHSHRQGVGSALLRAVEAASRREGGRLLLVETSSTPAQDAARAFYANQGFDEEGRVRDYWEDGDDLVLYRKRLS